MFTNAFEALPRYERRKQPFRAWLFVIARNYALNQLDRQGRVEVLEPEEIERRQEEAGEVEPAPGLPILDWITDPELLMFVERLPLVQRQVLALSFMLGLRSAEIGEILGRTPGDVRKLQSRAIVFLRERMAAIGREPDNRRDRTMLRPVKRADVLRARRFSL